MQRVAVQMVVWMIWMVLRQLQRQQPRLQSSLLQMET
jgi:hypothetical protein